MPAPQLILVRHAHADWPQYRGRDFDRPLTPQGVAGARDTGLAIQAAGLRPALLLASPARRTRQTAELIAAELQLPAGALQFLDTLYNAPQVTLEVEARVATACSGLVLLVAHNPGVSELARLLAGDPVAPNYSPGEWRLLPAPGPSR
ncbi:MAG: histidine phosphatase family protein [Steroidobacteraceae bacterium]